MRDATDEETAEILEALMGYVSVMPDPRQDQGKDQGKRHALGMMIVMALTAVLSGADDWADVVAFSESQKGWLSELCRMPHGVPCVSTFENVFSMLAPKAFSRILIELSERLVQNKRKDRQIAIDGKRLRCSFDDACKARRTSSAACLWRTDRFVTWSRSHRQQRERNRGDAPTFTDAGYSGQNGECGCDADPDIHCRANQGARR